MFGITGIINILTNFGIGAQTLFYILKKEDTLRSLNFVHLSTKPGAEPDQW